MSNAIIIYIIMSLVFGFFIHIFIKDKSEWADHKDTWRTSMYAMTILLFIYAIVTIAFLALLL